MQDTVKDTPKTKDVVSPLVSPATPPIPPRAPNTYVPFKQKSKADQTMSSKIRIYTKKGDTGQTSLFNGKKINKGDSISHATGSLDELTANLNAVHFAIISQTKRNMSNQFQVVGNVLNVFVLANLFFMFANVDMLVANTLLIINVSYFLNIYFNSLSKTTRYDYKDLSCMIKDIICDVGQMSACLSTGEVISKQKISNPENFQIEYLERIIDSMTDEMPKLTNFISITHTDVSVKANFARTACRKAERYINTVDLSGHYYVDETLISYINRLSDMLFTIQRYSDYIENYDEITVSRSDYHNKAGGQRYGVDEDSCEESTDDSTDSISDNNDSIKISDDK